MPAELVTLEDLDPKVQRALSRLDRLEALVDKRADERDEMQVRLSAAAMFARQALITAAAALDDWNYNPKRHQRNNVHDLIVETLAHLRTLAAVLSGTPPDTREVPTRNRARH